MLLSFYGSPPTDPPGMCKSASVSQFTYYSEKGNKNLRINKAAIEVVLFKLNLSVLSQILL